MPGLSYDAMLQAPRAGAAQASPDGKRWLQFSSEHSFDTARTRRSVTVGRLDGQVETILDNLKLGDVLWATSDTILYARPVDADENSQDVDTTKSDADQPKGGAKGVSIWAKQVDSGEHHRVGELKDAEGAGDFRAVELNDGKVLFGFAVDVFASHPSWNAYEEGEKAWNAHKRGAEVRTYESLPYRHWNTWNEGTKRHVFVVELSQIDGRLRFDAKDVQSPMQASVDWSVGDCYFNAGLDLAMSKTHIAFGAYDPATNPAYTAAIPIWLIKLGSGEQARQISTKGVGSCLSPSFSRDGQQLVYGERPDEFHHTDLARVVIYDLVSDSRRIVSSPDWDLSADIVRLSSDMKTVYIAAEDFGASKLFRLDIPDDPKQTATPQALTSAGTVSSIEVLPASEDLILTIHSFQHPQTPFLSKPDSTLSRLHDSAPAISKLGLKATQSLYFKGANPHQDVQYWLFEPQDFDPSRKYPLFFVVHGGPTSGLHDVWSTRWNCQVWASVGFVAVINFTGSSGFGKQFMDGVKRQWGGLPYDDLRLGYQHILKTRPEIDPERTIALGGSYGGYMMSQIASRPFGFKALISHACSLELAGNWYRTDEPAFMENQVGEAPWLAREEYAKWDPLENAGEWRTPMLITHGQQDFRCDVSDAYTCFNVLQKNSTPSRLVVFEHEGHFINKPINARHWQKELLDWMERWVGLGPR